MRRKKNGETPGIYDPNMTPLIDVSLVLVVILLVATPMALQSSISVQKSAASAQQAAEKARVERVEITVVSPDSVIVNRQGMSRAQLAPTLVSLLQASTTRQVAVRCRPGVMHGTFVSVLDDVKECGAAQIAVQGR
jgi:biopolymer transport protein ExbD